MVTCRYRPQLEKSLIIIIFIPLGVKIPRVKSKIKSKRKAEVVTPRR